MSRSMQKPPCPTCGSSRDVIPVVYGYPSGIARREAEQGNFHLGGCLPRGGTWKDEWSCRTCDPDGERVGPWGG